MPENTPLFDFSALDFGPAWAREPADAPRPAAAEEPPESRRPSREERHDRRPERPFRQRRGGDGGRRDRRGGGGRTSFDSRRRPHEERPAPPVNPFPWLRIAFAPTPAAVETVVQQIRHTGKTYSLFDIARMLLRNPVSYVLELSCASKPAEGPFYIAKPDGSVWLSREAAVRHLLGAKLENFYRAETVEIAPPKGNFNVVAVCGMSGTLLGPPNLHGYERTMRELHRQKFSRMDFEVFRSRLKMDRSPEVIERWRAEASKAVHYFVLGDEGAEKLEGLSAVEAHFMAHHAAENIAAETTCTAPGNPRTVAMDSALLSFLTGVLAEEMRFPLRLAQSLSRALSQAGLRFRKSPNRTTWVSSSRPRHLDLSQVAVSDSIRNILETIRGKKIIRRQELLDMLAPSPPSETAAVDAAPPEDPARQTVIENLLWLTHEGYVIEYSDGRLESVPPHPPRAEAVEKVDAASENAGAPPDFDASAPST